MSFITVTGPVKEFLSTTFAPADGSGNTGPTLFPLTTCAKDFWVNPKNKINVTKIEARIFFPILQLYNIPAVIPTAVDLSSWNGEESLTVVFIAKF